MKIGILRGTSDAVIDSIITVLENYQTNYPQAQIDLYRQNSVSVRVRIIDPEFAGLSKLERSQRVWQYLNQLDEEVQADISTILLLTPDETESSFANMDFNHPIPSQI